MQGCISTSKKPEFLRLASILALVLCASATAFAAGKGGTTNDEIAPSDEIIGGPFSEYGEFDTSEDEASDEKFFQFGRFFGLGVGAGFTTATGNAGLIYQGGFPTVDFRIAYWFDFAWAFQIDVQNSKHNYDIQPDGLTDVNLFRILFQIKYYFDTRDLSAPITFVGPHLIGGAGFYTRTDNIGSGGSNSQDQNVQSQSATGFHFGGGFELTLKPKKTYLQLEALVHLVTFGDQLDPKFNNTAGIPDRTGAWVSAGLSIMWTW